MPDPDDKDWPKFERAWRQWYKTSVKHDDPEKQAENAAYYGIGKDHVVSFGWGVVEVPHTGSIQVTKIKELPKWDTAQYEYDVS